MTFHCGFAGDLCSINPENGLQTLLVQTHSFCNYSEVTMRFFQHKALMNKILCEENRQLMIQVEDYPIWEEPFLSELKELEENGSILCFKYSWIEPPIAIKKAFPNIPIFNPRREDLDWISYYPYTGSADIGWTEYLLYRVIAKDNNHKILFTIDANDALDTCIIPGEKLRIAKFKYLTTLLEQDIVSGLVIGFYINNWKFIQTQPHLLTEIRNTVQEIRKLV